MHDRRHKEREKKGKREKKPNQIRSNQFYLSSIAWGVVAQSPEPGAHVLNARAFRIELEFRNVGFCGEGKTGVPGEKPLGAEKRTNNKLNPHMTSSPGIEPGPHWWKASALTTAPSLLPSSGDREWLFLQSSVLVKEFPRGIFPPPDILCGTISGFCILVGGSLFSW